METKYEKIIPLGTEIKSGKLKGYIKYKTYWGWYKNRVTQMANRMKKSGKKVKIIKEKGVGNYSIYIKK